MSEGYVKKREIMQGSRAIAETVKAIEPGVIASYPITPQTHIVEHLARLVANGELKSKYVTADSEFSAASIAFGATAAGVRSYTASSSQGLLLMTEVIFNMVGTRLPVLFTAVNRSLSPPINIQVDHQDTMTLRDSGVIQVYVESIQEAIDMHIQIVKVAENKKVLLPAMVCMDGWILSHVYEPVTLWQDDAVKEFLPPYEPVFKLDPQNPLTYGALADPEIIMEFRYMVHQALLESKKLIQDVAKEFKDLFGNYYGGLLEETGTEDAEIIFVAMGSMAGTIKVALENLRSKGKKIGLVRVRSYRPFPDEELRSALSSAKAVLVLDRSISNSSGGILGNEVRSCLYHLKERPVVVNYIIGLGGREIYPETIEKLVQETEGMLEKDSLSIYEPVFWELNKDLL